MRSKDTRQTFMFSATFPDEVQSLAREFLRDYVWIGVGRVGSTVENIEQRLLEASSDPNTKMNMLLTAINEIEGRTLVFVQKKRTAAWVRQCLQQFGVASEEIHGDRTQMQREHALRQFREGRTRVLVATDVAARGLDVPAVTHVIQFDMPISSEDFDTYVHRIGRTGRAGKSGVATSFYVPGRETGEGNGKIAQLIMRLLQENNQVNTRVFLSSIVSSLSQLPCFPPHCPYHYFVWCFRSHHRSVELTFCTSLIAHRSSLNGSSQLTITTTEEVALSAEPR
jgi:ATP-dependent RNA helicase DDX3X